jgi:hypothetical protein
MDVDDGIIRDITVAGLDEEMDWSCWDCVKDEESE